MEVFIDITLLTMLAAVAIMVIYLRSLFAVVMLFSIYSLLSALIFVVLDAVDVAFTEAAVGAGISTVLMLSTLVITGWQEKSANRKFVLPLIIVVTTGAALIWGTLDMPSFGDANNPIHQHVAPRYINDSLGEVGMPNIVTSVLASYRGFDTWGEVTVVFTALVGVLSLLGMRWRRRLIKSSKSSKGHSLTLLQVSCILLIPFILLFALYVQFHGDFGPGGGFQAGVIFASAVVLFTLTFGLNKALMVIPLKFIRPLAAIGVLIYGGTGIVSMLLGGSFLDYDFLAHDPLNGQHYGILAVELGVGIAVAAVMIAIFFAFVIRFESGVALSDEMLDGTLLDPNDPNKKFTKNS